MPSFLLKSDQKKTSHHFEKEVHFKLEDIEISFTGKKGCPMSFFKIRLLKSTKYKFDKRLFAKHCDQG